MSSWSELSQDLLIDVAEHIQKLEDFFALRAVCKQWFVALEKKKYFKGLWLRQGIPYLMLPVRDDIEDARDFYSLVESEIVASVKIPKCKSRKCLESLGWLLAIDIDRSMCLLDPFSDVEIPLPHQSTIPGYPFQTMNPYIFIHKIVLSARPSETSDFILMVICGINGQIGFWRPGNESWNIVEYLRCCRDVMYYDGHFYAIEDNGFAYSFTLEGDNMLEYRTITRLVVDAVKNSHAKTINGYTCSDNLYILKTSESLFFISRTALWWDDKEQRLYYNTSHFRVYEVNMSTKTWTQINNVGRNIAIFVGHNTTFAVDTFRLFGKIKDNHIYFSDDGWESYHFDDMGEGSGKDMGAYNIETGTIDSFYSGELLVSKVCPSIWITPSF